MTNIATRTKAALMKLCERRRIDGLYEPVFFGINLASNDGLRAECSTKLYTSCSKTALTKGRLSEYLMANKLVGGCEAVLEEPDAGRQRLCYGLKERAHCQIDQLYEHIARLKDHPPIDISICRALSRIGCDLTNDEELSTLYYFGTIATGESIETLKFYYLTRHWSESENISACREYDDSRYLTDLERIEPFSVLVGATQELLSKSGSNLWMAGLDFFSANKTKAKMYFCNLDRQFEESLLSITGRAIHDELEEILDKDEDLFHLPLSGAAISLNEDKMSVNLYYSFKI